MKQVSDNDAANGGGEGNGLDKRDVKTGQFVEGVSGNPSGRPKGSRNKLGEAFINDLFDHWKENGIEVLHRAAKEKPADYLKVAASILPKDIKVSLETMSDKELSASINQLSESLGLTLVPLGADIAEAIELNKHPEELKRLSVARPAPPGLNVDDSLHFLGYEYVHASAN